MGAINSDFQWLIVLRKMGRDELWRRETVSHFFFAKRSLRSLKAKIFFFGDGYILSCGHIFNPLIPTVGSSFSFSFFRKDEVKTKLRKCTFFFISAELSFLTLSRQTPFLSFQFEEAVNHSDWILTRFLLRKKKTSNERPVFFLLIWAYITRLSFRSPKRELGHLCGTVEEDAPLCVLAI